MKLKKKKRRETIWVKLSNLQLGSWDYNLIKSRLKKIKKLNLNKPNIKGYNWNEKKKHRLKKNRRKKEKYYSNE
jgi:hypothetical protein